MPIRLASQERDSADEIDGKAGGSHRNQNGNGTSSGNVDTTMTLTLTNAPTPNHTSSTANMKRRSQVNLKQIKWFFANFGYLAVLKFCHEDASPLIPKSHHVTA